jgi:hypothetical protein
MTFIPKLSAWGHKNYHRDVCVCRMMLVGLGGNNGTTITGGILANKQYVHANLARSTFLFEAHPHNTRADVQWHDLDDEGGPQEAQLLWIHHPSSHMSHWKLQGRGGARSVSRGSADGQTRRLGHWRVGYFWPQHGRRHGPRSGAARVSCITSCMPSNRSLVPLHFSVFLLSSCVEVVWQQPSILVVHRSEVCARCS